MWFLRLTTGRFVLLCDASIKYRKAMYSMRSRGETLLVESQTFFRNWGHQLRLLSYRSALRLPTLEPKSRLLLVFIFPLRSHLCWALFLANKKIPQQQAELTVALVNEL